MKIKELRRGMNVCWSPADQYPIQIAAGSSAQQVDVSFSSNSCLELYSLNLKDPGLELEPTVTLQTQHKFHKLVWSGAGIIVGGCDNGLIEFYSSEKLVKNTSEALVGSSTKHNGHVSSLDINPYQKNLLASGASESEIFIWDLNNTSQPMAPGNKSQPCDHVQGIAWNQQVQHILGSAFPTRCVIWDLRKNEPIMKLSDASSLTRWRSLAWHPGVATQLCVASEDDRAPNLQLWDLRMAASPLTTMEGHTAGVLALSWSRHDEDLLLSASKDGSILCWSPNHSTSGVSAWGSTLVCGCGGGALDVSWSGRVPGLLLAAAAAAPPALHTLLPAGGASQSLSSQSNILDSFGGAAGPLPTMTPTAPPPQPPRPPAWMRRSVGAQFAFGGKLVTFERYKDPASPKIVNISQVVSDPDVVEKSAELDNILNATLSQEPGATEALAEYCRNRGDAATEQRERYAWFFLRANFLHTFREEVINLLGFKQDEIPSKFKSPSATAGDVTQNDLAALSRGESTETEAELSTDNSTDLSDAHTLIERKLANIDLGSTVTNVTIPNGEDPTSMICRALVCGNLEEAVELCLESRRTADALVIAALGSPELVYKVQQYHLKQTAHEPVSLLTSSLLTSRWTDLVNGADPRSWRHTLAALVTHCDGETLAEHCELLGDKLSRHSDPSLSDAALVCYLCASSGDLAASKWGAGPDVAALLRRASEARGRSVQCGGAVERALVGEGGRRAAQGWLGGALRVLTAVRHHDLADRIRIALGEHTQVAGNTSRQTPAPQQQQRRGTFGQLSSSNVNNAYNPVPSPYEGSPWQAPPPPRPSSVGPTSGGISTRSKYKVDPSVQAAPLYNQYNFNNPISTQPQYGFNNPLPDQYSTASVPNPAINTAPLNPPINPLPNPINSVNSQFNPLSNPINSLSNTNPSMNGGYYNPQGVEPAVPAMPAPPKNVAPGWNDPPMLSSKPRNKAEQQPAQAPITHPLFGVEPPPQHVPLAPVNQYTGQGPQYPGQQPYTGQQAAFPGQQTSFPGQVSYPSQQNQFPGQQNQFPGQMGQYTGQQAQYPGQFEQQQFQQYPVQQPPAGYQKQENEAPVQAAEPVVKPPLPEHLIPLQTGLDSLRQDCIEKATNPQTKRKLEDVHRRLETMYDLLRENKLSESAVSTLLLCEQHARRGDFAAALEVATGLASGTDFAAAASFLPGLKVLLQLAAHQR